MLRKSTIKPTVARGAAALLLHSVVGLGPPVAPNEGIHEDAKVQRVHPDSKLAPKWLP